MNKRYAITILLLTYNICNAQNLVPNGDFELYFNCPSVISNFQGYVSNWTNPSTGAAAGTPDYYNQCSTGAMGVPVNHAGTQDAHSGVAYSGIVIARENSNTDFREYMEVQLTTTLSADTCYHFEMYINLAGFSEYNSDAIGAYFSNNLISGFTGIDTLPYIPQISNTPGAMPDSVNWMLVQGDYAAIGGENYLLIGNFKSHDYTTTSLFNGANTINAAYVFIDDVSLTKTTCSTGINELNESNAVRVYPNPSSGVLTVETKSNDLAEIKIYDPASRLLLRKQFRNSSSVDIGNLSPGIYIYELRTEAGVMIQGKVVKD